MSTTTWLSRQPRDNARLTIVCFPPSGTSSSVFGTWHNALPPAIDIVTVHLPGRGPRADEPLVFSLAELADEIAQELTTTLRQRPFAFFGHSMGAFLAFSTAARLVELGAPQPEALMVSGAQAPHLPLTQYHTLDDGELRERLIGWGGIPDSLRNEPDLLQAAMPIIRADVHAVETYRPTATRLSCPISVFAGRDDPLVNQSGLLAWHEMTTGRCVTHLLPGGHFYLTEQRHELLSLIQQDIGMAALAEPQLPGPATGACGRGVTAEPVAVIGMGCRLPGASTASQLWDLLVESRDLIREIPPQRWDVDRLGPRGPGRTYARWGGLIDHVDQFDAGFFGLSPREAQRMDPQLRLLMMVTHEAVEDAHLPASSLVGKRGGVFVGQSTAEYWEMQTQQTSLDLHSLTGSGLRAFLAGRLSYMFDLRGPSMTVDSACSSSLTAVHLACQSLRSGESEIAFAGGASLVLKPDHAVAFAQAHVMSPIGRCTFADAQANGYVRSDGVVVVVLKRLADALADGDPIHAVLRGSAVNNDGRTGSSILAPSVAGQRAVITDALAAAGIAASDVSYVEAHGTGTPTGDTTELTALDQIYGKTGRACLVGSLKSNIGHTEPVAGISGLLKAVLAVKHRRIPASLHVHALNPAVDWVASGLRVPTQLEDWPHAGPAIAAVSSFGLSGSNTHMIVSEPPARPARPVEPVEWRPQVLPVSAQSPTAVRALAGAYADLLTGSGEGVCAAAARGRTHYPVRFVASGSAPSELAAQLRDCVPNDCRDQSARRLVWVFSGQGSQWPAMAEELRASSPVFRDAHDAAIDACDALITINNGMSLRTMLLGPGRDGHDRVELIQPAIWTMQVALAAMWTSWGLRPDAVVGQSMGEVAAAHVAGALTLQDAAQVIVNRSRLVAEAGCAGAMLVTTLTPEDAEREGVRWNIDVAGYHGPRSTVLSGDPDAIGNAARDLAARGVHAQQVDVTFASHSRHMDPLCGPLRAALAEVTPHACQTPMFSTVRSRVIDGAELDADYWADNLRSPVFLSRAIRELADETVFLEVSPHPLLIAPITATVDGATAVGSLHRRQSAARSLGNAMRRLYMTGIDIDWNLYYPGDRPILPLPRYPWQLERVWFTPTAQGLLPGAIPASTGAPDVAMNWTADGGVLIRISPAGQYASTRPPGDNVEAFRPTVATTGDVHAFDVDAAVVIAVEVAAILGLEASKIPRHQPFSLLGLDSVMLVELRERLMRRTSLRPDLSQLARATIDSLLAEMEQKT